MCNTPEEEGQAALKRKTHGTKEAGGQGEAGGAGRSLEAR